MKKEPCIRLGMRIRPKIREKPDDSRNKRPPKARLLMARMAACANVICVMKVYPRTHETPRHSTTATQGTRDQFNRSRARRPATRQTNSGRYSRYFAGGWSRA